MSDITLHRNSKVGCLVKSGQTTSYADYDDGYYENGIPRPVGMIDNGDNTFTDPATGKMWVYDMAYISADGGVIPLVARGNTFLADTLYTAGDLSAGAGGIFVCTNTHTSPNPVNFDATSNFTTGTYVYVSGTGYYECIADYTGIISTSSVQFSTFYAAGTYYQDDWGDTWQCNADYTSPASDTITSAWAPSTQYYVDDLVNIGGYVYQCTTDHVSDSADFWTDYDLGYWSDLYSQTEFIILQQNSDWTCIGKENVWSVDYYPDNFTFVPGATSLFGLDSALNPNSWVQHRFRRTATTLNLEETIYWTTALAGAKTCNYLGYTDWRVPNINELQTLINYGKKSPATYTGVGGATGTFWSSTTSASSSVNARWVNFTTNGEVGASNKSTLYYVRLVRDTGKSWSTPPTGQVKSYTDYDDGYYFQRSKYAPQVTDWHEASTAADDNAVGTLTWQNPSYALTTNTPPINATNAASATATGSGQITHYLKLTNFNFSEVPDDHEIYGVEVETTKAVSNSASFKDYRVYLVVGGAIKTAVNKADTVYMWATNNVSPYVTVKTHSVLGDIYNQPILPSVVKASDFGVAFSAQCAKAGTSVAFVGYVRMRVWHGPSRYILPGDGTVKDMETGLQWVQSHSLIIPDSTAVPGNKILTDRGNWAVNTSYNKGDRAGDTADSTHWICIDDHISAASGTFANDRAGGASGKWVQTIWYTGMTGKGPTMTLANAITASENLVYAGYSDWYMSNIIEAYSITDKAYFSPPAHPAYFPLANDTWNKTSTTDPNNVNNALAPYGNDSNIRSDAKTTPYAFKVCRRWK